MKTISLKQFNANAIVLSAVFVFASIGNVNAQDDSNLSLQTEVEVWQQEFGIDIDYSAVDIERIPLPDIEEGEFSMGELVIKTFESVGLKVGFRGRQAVVLEKEAFDKAVAKGELQVEPTAEFENVNTLETLVVTGSRLRRDFLEPVDSVRVLGQDNKRARGALNINEVVLGSSIAAGVQSTGRNNTSLALSGEAGSSQVDLRGLGQNRTLVLVNGRAVPPGGIGVNATTTDLSSLPSAVTDRVEILGQGASSIYGSESLAGTVNYITLEGLDGFRLELDAALPVESGGEQGSASLAWGKSFDRSSVLVAYQYEKRKALKWGDRDGFRCDIAATRDPLTGRRTDIDPTTNLPRCTDQPYGFASFTPDDSFESNGASLVPQAGGQFGGVNGLAELPTRIDENDNLIVEGANNDVSATRPNADLIGESDRHNLFFQADLDTDLLGGTRFYTEIGYATNRDASVVPAQVLALRLGADNPLNPFSAAFDNPNISQGELTVNIPDRFVNPRTDSKSDSGRIVLGAEGSLALDDWRWSLDYQYGRAKSSLEARVLSASRVAQALNATFDDNGNLVCADSSNGCVVLNPLDPGLLGGTAQIDPRLRSFVTDIAREETVTQRSEWTLAADGTAFDLPSGPVLAAVGVNYRTDQVVNNRSPILRRNDVFNNLLGVQTIDKNKVDTLGVFAEIEFPVIRDRQWAQDVSVNLSGRYTEDDVFDNFSYKASGRYTVNEFASLRASYSTSFRSPNLFERFRRRDFVADDIGNTGFIDPCDGYGFASLPGDTLYENCQGLGLPVTFLANAPQAIFEGANPNLKPEEGDSLMLGLTINLPAPELSFSMTYFDINVENAIRSFDATQVLVDCFNSVGLSSPFCGRDFIGARDANGFLTTVDSRDRNATVDSVSGVDFDVSTFGEFAGFSLGAQLSMTYLKSRESQTVAGAPIVDSAGGINFPKWKGNLSLFALLGKFDASYNINYIGKVDEAVVSPGFYASAAGQRLIQDIDAFSYHSISLSYSLSDDTLISLGINNLFDKKPPIVSQLPSVGGSEGVFTTGGVPLGEYDTVGRTVIARISTNF